MNWKKVKKGEPSHGNAVLGKHKKGYYDVIDADMLYECGFEYYMEIPEIKNEDLDEVD